MEKKMVLALFFMMLTATVTAQTPIQVLQNPEFDGCSPGNSGGYAVSPWTGGQGSFSFLAFGGSFTNPPANDDCFMFLAASFPGQTTQTNIILDTSLVYEFETLIGCYLYSGGSCTIRLSINGVDIALTNNVHLADYPIPFYSITAKNIRVSSSPATLAISVSAPSSIDLASIAHATLTASTDSDGDKIQDSVDNCPSVYNPNQADFNQDGVGDACECSPDNIKPTIECRPSITVTLSVPPFSSTVLPSTPVFSASDNCGPPSLSLDKTVFTLRDSVAPVTVKATATDGNSKTDSCSTSVVTRMIGSILTNSPSSLLTLPRGIQTTLTWTTNVASFSSSDTVTIKVVTLAGVTVTTVVNAVRFTDGGAAVVFSASLSNVSTFKLNIFLNNIPAGSHTIKFA